MQTLKHTLFFSLVLAVLTGMSGCSNSDGSSTSELAMPYQPAGWYMKSGVYATAADGTVYKHTSAGVFGELLQSQDDKDPSDIPGYGTAILQVVFPKTAWAGANGDYFSDYRSWDGSDTTKKSWIFQVKNQHSIDLSNAPLTITLDGAFGVTYLETEYGGIDYKVQEANPALKEALVLVDIDNHTTYTADQLPTAGLKMDGLHTRTFRWVLGVVTDEDYLPLAAPSAAKTAAFVGTKASELMQRPQNSNSKLLPPSF